MLRFGKPMKCDRDGAKCYECKNAIPIGELLYWEFSEKHRYCFECGQKVADQQNQPKVIVLAPETIEALSKLLQPSSSPAKPGLFSGSSANVGMTSEQSRAFNDLIKRVDSLEKKLKEVTGES